MSLDLSNNPKTRETHLWS